MTTARSLPSELTIYTVGELHPQWLAWLADTSAAHGPDDAADGAFCVDAAAVVEVDAAGVQLLISLQNALSARHQVLRLVAPSPALASGCTALGVAALACAFESDGAPA